MWRRQTDWLNFSRQEMRRNLSKSLGFLFVDHAKSKWKFRVPRSYYGKMTEISNTKVFLGDDLVSIQSMNKHNKDLLNKLYADFGQLKLQCNYEVEICKGEWGKCSWKKTDTVTVDWEICIIECALKCVTMYYQAESHDEVMRFVGESLKMVYVVAMALATVLEQANKHLEAGKSNTDILRERYPLFVFIEAEDARMDAINEEALQISQQDYEDLLEHGDEEKENSDPQTNALQATGFLNESIINADLL